MGYNKTRRNRRRNYKPKPSRWQTYGNAAMQLASDAMKGVRFVKGLINTEFKNIDTNNIPTVTAGGVITLLNGTVQGDGQFNREGSSFRMKSIDVRYQGTYNAAVGYNTYRVMLVLDQQANGVAPALTDILAVNAVDSPRNLDYRKRFLILYDKVHCIGTGNGQQNYDHLHIKNEYHTQCFAASNTGTVADITTNAVYLVMFSDQAVNGPTVNYYGRIRFLDN